MTFIIYSKTGCPYCDKIKTVLELTEQKHVVYLLDREFTKENFYDKFGEQSTFPQVICDNSVVGGCVDTIRFLKGKKIL
tara:strand:+ start:8249 stop:8485 length:237 start_codon:yes stop_codon:yes gene_type:complete